MRLKALKGHWRGKSFVCEWMERSYVDRSCKPCFWSGDRFFVFTTVLRCLERICGGASSERIGALRARGWHKNCTVSSRSDAYL